VISNTELREENMADFKTKRLLRAAATSPVFDKNQALAQ
jgi:hypothetical protein